MIALETKQRAETYIQNGGANNTATYDYDEAGPLLARRIEGQRHTLQRDKCLQLRRQPPVRNLSIRGDRHRNPRQHRTVDWSVGRQWKHH